MRFKIDWASLIVRRRFAVLVCFNLYLRTISKYKGRFNGGFFASRFKRGLFSEFSDMLFPSLKTVQHLLKQAGKRMPVELRMQPG